MSRNLIPTLLALFAATGAGAAELAPQAGTSIALGDVRGVAYYTVESAGYRVVTTVSAGASTPIRLIATLTAGQSIALSVPGAIGAQALAFEIRRVGDTIVVEGDRAEADGPERTAAVSNLLDPRPRW
jgi:hypothetical protein